MMWNNERPTRSATDIFEESRRQRQQAERNAYGLLPCTFCGSTGTKGVIDRQLGKIYAMCANCGASSMCIRFGPIEGMKDARMKQYMEIITEKWNTRA